MGNSNSYAIGGSAYDFAGKNIKTIATDYMGKSKFLFIKAEQELNDKWRIYLRYVHSKFIDTNGIDNVGSCWAGVVYRYTQAIYFELGYDMVGHGDNDKIRHASAINDKESVVRFKTTGQFLVLISLTKKGGTASIESSPAFLSFG